MKNPNTQLATILKMLKSAKAKGITPWQALRGAGCFRMASVIFRLRHAGYRIDNVGQKTKTGYCGKYVLRG